MNTLRELDIALLEAEAYAEEIYQSFMGEMYGKRKRPDTQPALSQPSQMPQPTPLQPEVNNGAVYG